MATLDFLSAFRSREGEDDILKATWYIAAVRMMSRLVIGP